MKGQAAPAHQRESYQGFNSNEHVVESVQHLQ
jgi:hypothetical protein